MSQTTEVCWYRKEPIGYPAWIPLVERTLAIWDAYELEFVYENPWEQRNWRTFQRNDFFTAFQRPVLKNCDLPTFWSRVRKNRGYYLTYYMMRTKREWWNRLESIAIPESIGANVYPSAPGITIGNHDIFDIDWEKYIARASFSFTISSSGTPPVPALWESLYFAAEPVKELEAKLIEIWGPLERCWYTSS